MITCKNYYGGSWVDISDYVNPERIPFISRNRDWTMRVEVMNTVCFGAIKDVRGSNFKFNSGDRIAFYNNSNLLFCGFVTKAPYDYDKEQFNLEITHDLGQNDNHLVDYPTLHSTFATGSNTVDGYRPMSYYNGPTVGVLWAMKCMFSIMGFTLDTSLVDNVTAFHWADENVDIPYKGFFFGENELYNINQKDYCYHNVIDTSYLDYKKDKIKFSDLLNEILSSLTLHIQEITPGNFTLYAKTNNYSIADNDKYVYLYEPSAGYESTDSLGLSYIPSSPHYCVADIGHQVSNLQAVSIGEGGGISLLSKFRIYFEHQKVALDTNKCLRVSNVTHYYLEGVLCINTETPHGLSVGDRVMLLGIAGMIDLSTVAIEWIVGAITDAYQFRISCTTDQYFISGGSGSVYKGSYSDYYNSYWWSWLEMLIQPNNVDNVNILKNKVAEKSSDYVKETIKCPITDSIATVIENFISIDEQNECSEIVQEVYP